MHDKILRLLLIAVLCLGCLSRFQIVYAGEPLIQSNKALTRSFYFNSLNAFGEVSGLWLFNSTFHLNGTIRFNVNGSELKLLAVRTSLKTATITLWYNSTFIAIRRLESGNSADFWIYCDFAKIRNTVKTSFIGFSSSKTLTFAIGSTVEIEDLRVMNVMRTAMNETICGVGLDLKDMGHLPMVWNPTARTLVFNLPSSNFMLDPSTVASVTNLDNLHYNNQQRSFKILGNYWVFYINGTTSSNSHFGYKYSADGTTWSTFTSVRFPCVYSFHADIDFNGTHLAYAIIRASTTLYHRLLIPYSNGSFSYVASENSVSLGGYSSALPTCTFNDAGDFFVGYKFYRTLSPSRVYPQVIMNTNRAGGWTTKSGFPYNLTTTSDSSWIVTVENYYSTDEIFCFYGRTSQRGLYKEYYSWDAWTPEAYATTSNIRNGYYVDMVSNATHIYYVYGTSGAYDIKFQTCKLLTGLIGSEETVITVSTSVIQASISLNPSNNFIYAFWMEPIGTYVYYEWRNATAWSARTQLVYETGTLNAVLEDSIDSMKRMESSVIGVVYNKNNIAPYDIRFALFSLIVAKSWHSEATWTAQLFTRAWISSAVWTEQLFTRQWRTDASWLDHLITRSWILDSIWLDFLITRSWILDAEWMDQLITRTWRIDSTWLDFLTTRIWTLDAEWLEQLLTRQWSVDATWTLDLLTRQWNYETLWTVDLLTRAWQAEAVWTVDLFTRAWNLEAEWLILLNTMQWNLEASWMDQLVARAWTLDALWTAQLFTRAWNLQTTWIEYLITLGWHSEARWTFLLYGGAFTMLPYWFLFAVSFFALGLGIWYFKKKSGDGL